MFFCSSSLLSSFVGVLRFFHFVVALHCVAEEHFSKKRKDESVEFKAKVRADIQEALMAYIRKTGCFQTNLEAAMEKTKNTKLRKDLIKDYQGEPDIPEVAVVDLCDESDDEIEELIEGMPELIEDDSGAETDDKDDENGAEKDDSGAKETAEDTYGVNAYSAAMASYHDGAAFQFPRWAEAVGAILSIAPSEAEVERLFSSYKQFQAPRRNRLKQKVIHNMMYTRYNHEEPPANTTETKLRELTLTEENEEESQTEEESQGSSESQSELDSMDEFNREFADLF